MKKIIFSLALFFTMFSFGAKADGLGDAFAEKGPLNNIAGGAGYKSDGETLEGQIGNIIQIVLSFLGVIFLGLIIYAGFLWMTAQGDQAKVVKAKDIMERAVIGLVVVVSAYAISSYVLQSIINGQLKTETSGL